MEQNVKHKLYMGYKGFMLPIPQVLSKKGAQKGEKGARANANSLTDLERRVHHFIVLKMVKAKEPIISDVIADEMKIPLDHVCSIIDKLENLKTFIYRSDGKGIDWAYPLSLDNTDFLMTSSSGDTFFAA
ncbi:hypothetical protein MHK_004252 [Candidatus Magnetomorum sp. HK-1]|nr:hypothetical protein MHK_004252 [Candidatus Magnetomorum sp. HK-1]